MRQNPIYKKDELLSNRSMLLPVLLTAVNATLCLLVLLNLYSISAGALDTGEIRYAAFLRVYYLIAGIELLLQLLLSPALTVASINTERERQTLGLLLTTLLSPGDIVLGKLMGALSTTLLLLLSSLPLGATVLIYGGITREQLLLLLLFYTVSAVYGACLGLTASAFFHSAAAAAAIAYVAVFLSIGLLLLLYYFRGELGLGIHLLYAGSLLFMSVLSVIMFFLCRWGIAPRRRKKRSSS